jgi:two-component system LytT family response regulator
MTDRRPRRVELPNRLRVIIADDERPARAFLAALLRGYRDAELIGDAATGSEAVELIEQTRPDLALLDMQMPELDGLGVVRMLHRDRLPLVAFVTGYDQYAIQAFEANAIDYLLKPVAPDRLRKTIDRAHERLEHADFRAAEVDRLKAVAEELEAQTTTKGYLRRIPVRSRGDILILRVDQIAAIVADGEILHITMVDNERHWVAYRLKDLEARLDPARFVRLSRGSLAAVDLIDRVNTLPNGTLVVTLRNNVQLPVSRIQGRLLRERLLRL